MYADIQPPRLCRGSGVFQGTLFPQKRLPGFNIPFKPASKRKNFPVLFPTVSLPSMAKLFTSTKGEPPSKPATRLFPLSYGHSPHRLLLTPKQHEQRLAEQSQPCHAKAVKIQTGKYELSGEEDVALNWCSQCHPRSIRVLRFGLFWLCLMQHQSPACCMTLTTSHYFQQFLFTIVLWNRHRERLKCSLFLQFSFSAANIFSILYIPYFTYLLDYVKTSTTKLMQCASSS